MRGKLGTMASGLAAVLLITVLAGYAGRWSPALEIISAFRLHLALLAAGLGVALGLVAMWRSAGLAVLAALIAAAGLGPVLTSHKSPNVAVASNGRPLTLLYANLLHLNPDPQALGAVLRTVDADILISSETPFAVTTVDGPLREHYPFRQFNSIAKAWIRTAIWSKYPLSGGDLYLNNTVAPTAASAVADLGEGFRLALIGAHFSRPSEGLRQVQADALGPMAAQLRQQQPTLPLVIAADFNAPPWSWIVSRSLEVTGTRIIGGHRITWKGGYPTPFGSIPAPWGQQIDHILVSEGITIDTIDTVALPGSDHLGVFVRLRIPAP